MVVNVNRLPRATTEALSTSGIGTVARMTSSAAASSSSDDTERVAYLSGCKPYNMNNGLLGVTGTQIPPTFSTCPGPVVCPSFSGICRTGFLGVGDLMSGKRNRMTKKLKNRAFLKVNYKYYA